MSHSEQKLVYKVKAFSSPHAAKTVLFFCPFGIRTWLLALPGMPIWRLRRKGYAVIAYSYGTPIATKSVAMTIANLDAIVQDAEARIERMNPDMEIVCFGTSMGTVLAANVAARNAQIKKVILNLSYADISDHIANLPSIRAISSKRLQDYLATTESESTMRAAFDPYSPLNLVQQFKGKKLLVYSSRNDRVLQLVHTVKFHSELDRAGISVELHINSRGGHYFAALVNYLRYRRWLDFLLAG